MAIGTDYDFARFYPDVFWELPRKAYMSISGFGKHLQLSRPSLNQLA